MWTEFAYMYRDASNHKAHGHILLSGFIDATDRCELLSRMEGNRYFIAEQLGLPALYCDLERWSAGPTDDDHCWHEFSGFVEHQHLNDETMIVWSSSAQFIKQLKAISSWDEPASPNFRIGERHLVI